MVSASITIMFCQQYSTNNIITSRFQDMTNPLLLMGEASKGRQLSNIFLFLQFTHVPINFTQNPFRNAQMNSICISTLTKVPRKFQEIPGNSRKFQESIRHVSTHKSPGSYTRKCRWRGNDLNDGENDRAVSFSGRNNDWTRTFFSWKMKGQGFFSRQKNFEYPALAPQILPSP